MRRVLVVLALTASLGLACNAERTEKEIVAAKADQTLRQLIAGMNAKKLPVLQTLLVVTSTTGGPPRALRDAELKQVVFPNPPYLYAGPGGPGYMQVRDGQGQKHRVKLIVLGEKLKVVARRSTLAMTGSSMPTSVQVVQFLEPVASK